MRASDPTLACFVMSFSSATTARTVRAIAFSASLPITSVQVRRERVCDAIRSYALFYGGIVD